MWRDTSAWRVGTTVRCRSIPRAPRGFQRAPNQSRTVGRLAKFGNASLPVRPYKKSINQSITQSLNQSINQMERSLNQSINQSNKWSLNQSINRRSDHSINQSINRKSINQSIDRSINQSINQSKERSLNQSINQSTDWPSERSCYWNKIWEFFKSWKMLEKKDSQKWNHEIVFLPFTFPHQKSAIPSHNAQHAFRLIAGNLFVVPPEKTAHNDISHQYTMK